MIKVDLVFFFTLFDQGKYNKHFEGSCELLSLILILML